MALLTAYPEASRIAKTDILIIDGSGGTRKIAGANAGIELFGLIHAYNHRNIYRGKNLGTALTSAQKTAITNGTFDDMYIGDYWVINGVTWMIADFDYWYQHGDTAFTKHHVVVIPSKVLYSAKMNDTNITTGAYPGSKMYTEYLDQARTAFQNAFGSNLLTHREYMANTVTDGVESAGAWFDSQVDLMNEIMVYGCRIRNSTHIPCNSKEQLALFRLHPNAIGRESVWLRDEVSAAAFAFVTDHGGASSGGASGSVGVRPVAAVGV